MVSTFQHERICIGNVLSKSLVGNYYSIIDGRRSTAHNATSNVILAFIKTRQRMQRSNRKDPETTSPLRADLPFRVFLCLVTKR